MAKYDDNDPFANTPGGSSWQGTPMPVPPAEPLPDGSPGLPPSPSRSSYPPPPPPPPVYGSPRSTSGGSGAKVGAIVVVLMLAFAGVGVAVFLAFRASDTPAPQNNAGVAEPTATAVDPDAIDYSRELDESRRTAPGWDGLAVGDCVTSPWVPDGADGWNIVLPDVVPCEGPHYGEIYVIAHVGGSEPTNDATFEYQVTTVCEGQAFERYVGVDSYYDSNLYYDVLYPDNDAWKFGNRDMACMLIEEDEETTGSLMGSGL